MDVFKEVLQRCDILQVCNMLGISLNRSKMCICPFPNHSEKTPSFSVSQQKQIFKCFGCGKAGDSINLVAEIYGIKNLEAAKLINQNLGLGIDFKENETKKVRQSREFQVNKYKEKQKIKQEFKEWEYKTLRILCDYSILLNKWERTEDWESDLYVEAMHNRDYVDYLIDDFFINGTEEDKFWFWKNKRKDVSRFESRIRHYRTISE
jgi:hypothetical protein